MELYPEDDGELHSYLSYEERKMHERFMEPFKIKSIKYMHSLGASAEDISKKTDEPLEKVKKILESE